MSPSAVLVDTDVISFLTNQRPLFEKYVARLHGRALLVSVVSIGEIEFGMELSNWGGRRRAELRSFLSGFEPVPPDVETARIWGSIRVGCQRKGRLIGHADAWIAATAIRLNLPLVTNNVRDYESVDGLELLL